MNDRATKKCPFCGEEIKAEAIKCRYCREFLDTVPLATAENSPQLGPQEPAATPVPPPEHKDEKDSAEQPVSETVAASAKAERSMTTPSEPDIPSSYNDRQTDEAAVQPVAESNIPPEKDGDQSSSVPSASTETPVSVSTDEAQRSSSFLKKVGCAVLICAAIAGFIVYLNLIAAAASGARFGEDPQTAEIRNKEDLIKSFWLSKAQQGDVDAQHTLGCALLLLGKNEEAVKWLALAAPKRTLAAWRLAWCHENGIGTTRSAEKAFQVLKTRVDAGNIDSDTESGLLDRLVLALGYRYGTGYGCERNEAEAARLFLQVFPPEKADELSSTPLAVVVPDVLSGSRADMAVINIGHYFEKEARDRLEEIKPPKIDRNLIATVLGEWYLTGRAGLPKDCNMAVKYLKLSNSPEAQYNLGLCYVRGDGVEKDPVEAAKWWRKAAEQGLAEAQNRYGACCQEGEGVEKDLKKAVYWYRKSAEQGVAKAQYNLGICFEYGLGVEKNLHQSAEWYSKAAEQAFEPAKQALKKMGK